MTDVQQEIMQYKQRQNRQHNLQSERLSCTWSIIVKTFLKNKCSPVISENPPKLSIPNSQEK